MFGDDEVNIARGSRLLESFIINTFEQRISLKNYLIYTSRMNDNSDRFASAQTSEASKNEELIMPVYVINVCMTDNFYTTAVVNSGIYIIFGVLR